MTIMHEDVIKLLLAILVGGLIGVEREFRDRTAGFRTIIFICVGATLFTIFSIKLGGDKDPVRIAANIVSGVGFIGAGAILRDEGRVMGVTTASTIWLAAALGMGIGGGYYLFPGVVTVIISIVLWIFPRFEERIGNIREQRTYQVVCLINHEKVKQLEARLREHGLRVKSRKRIKRGDEMICTWVTFGSPKNHNQFAEMLFADSDVKEFQF